jgi:dihydropteroate synthase
VVETIVPQVRIPISIDTFKAEVAQACLAAGAHIINDVTALADPAMVSVVRDCRAGLILMHMRGTPRTMQQQPTYGDVVADIRAVLEERLHLLTEAGIAAERVVVDPGIGFGKTLEHNLEILSRLEEFGQLGRPVCLGVSRKGFIGQLLDRPVDRRLAGSLAVACFAMSRRAVQILRVHDVEATRDVLTLWATLSEFGANKGTDA